MINSWATHDWLGQVYGGKPDHVTAPPDHCFTDSGSWCPKHKVAQREEVEARCWFLCKSNGQLTVSQEKSSSYSFYPFFVAFKEGSTVQYAERTDFCDTAQTCSWIMPLLDQHKRHLFSKMYFCPLIFLLGWYDCTAITALSFSLINQMQKDALIFLEWLPFGYFPTVLWCTKNMLILGTGWQQLCKQLSGHCWVGNSKLKLSQALYLFLASAVIYYAVCYIHYMLFNNSNRYCHLEKV